MIYRVIQVRMLALVVDKIGHAKQISTVALGTAAKTSDRALMKHGVTRLVHSLGVSPSFPGYIREDRSLTALGNRLSFSGVYLQSKYDHL